jgi:hypothetical protein
LKKVEIVSHGVSLCSTTSKSFVGEVDDVFQGLERLVLQTEDLFLTLAADGMSRSLKTFKQRFAKYLTDYISGHEKSWVWISLDCESRTQ